MRSRRASACAWAPPTSSASRWRSERRRQPRVPLGIPVRVVEYGRDEHEGTPVDLRTAGIKVRVPAHLPLRSVVRLTFTPPEDGPAITTISLVMRRDGMATPWRS